MKIKILIFCLIFFNGLSAFSKGYDMNVPLNGSSILSDDMQFKVLKDAYFKIQKKIPACFDYSVKDTSIIHYPYDVKKKNGKYVKGYWKEIWTVNACGKPVQIPLTFYINGKHTQYVFEEISI